MLCMPIAGKFMHSKEITGRTNSSNGGAVLRKGFVLRLNLPLNSWKNRSNCDKAELYRLARISALCNESLSLYSCGKRLSLSYLTSRNKTRVS
jgi:hypothetical protein